MAKIISFNSNEKAGRENIFFYLWRSYKSLNLFVKIYILTAILILFSTPFVVGNSQIFTSQAITPSISSVYFSYDLTFGYNVKIKLIDSDNNPVKNTEVAIYPSNSISKTDNKGEVYFTDISSGPHIVVAKLSNGEVTKEISVKGDSSVGEYTIKLNSSLRNNFQEVVYAGLAILVLLLVGIFFIKKKHDSAST